MPNVPPVVPVIAPGVTTTPDVFPQWGVKQTGSGGKDDYSVKEAKSSPEKETDIDNGYVTWFSTYAGAESFVSSENSLLNGNVSNLPGFNLVFGNDKGLLGRILKVVFGGALIIIGIMQLSGVKASTVAGTAAKAALV
jgi:hypothetical protein